MDEERDIGLESDDGQGGHVDVIPLVLGQVDAQRRAQMAAHVLQCATCRSEYDELAATVRESVARGAGRATTARLRSTGARRSWASSRADCRRSTPRLGWFAGAAAAIIAVVATFSWWTTSNDDAESIGDVSALELVNGGGNVGTVSVGDVDGETVMVVASGVGAAGCVVPVPDHVRRRHDQRVRGLAGRLRRLDRAAAIVGRQCGRHRRVGRDWSSTAPTTVWSTATFDGDTSTAVPAYADHRRGGRRRTRTARRVAGQVAGDVLDEEAIRRVLGSFDLEPASLDHRLEQPRERRVLVADVFFEIRPDPFTFARSAAAGRAPAPRCGPRLRRARS